MNVHASSGGLISTRTCYQEESFFIIKPKQTNMKQKFYSLFLTALFGMWGMQAGAQELTTTEVDGVTYYEIDDATDLVAFAELVNTGELSANGLLTADIDLSSGTPTATWELPIGTPSGIYSGTFDGQGHKITGLEGTSNGRFGLFGYIQNATVQNFSIAGKITACSADGEAAHGTGAIGWSESSHIFNVHSALEIEVVESNVHHVGGVVGSANYNNFLKGCTFSGTLKEEGGNTDCFGGVAGYTASDTIMFCANYGTISFWSAGAYAGGIAGYLNNTAGTIKGCLNAGKVTYMDEGEPSYGGAIIGRMRDNTPSKIQNNVWIEGSGYAGTGEGSVPSTVCATAEQLASGEICYYLNCDQTEIGWYQTLGTDEMPVLDATHAKVYMNGRLHCNGDVYEGATYSNEDTGIAQDEHDFVDGICSYCNLFNENFLTPNADGFYEIANARQFAWFEQLVNKGAFNANAILTADIDFSELGEDATWTPIGDWGATRGVSSAGYCGHFDGQGHTMTDFNFTGTQNYFGVFGVLTAGAVVENFTIYGEVTNSYKTMGVVGYTRDTETTIRGIHSYLNIYNTTAGNRYGGIIGSAVNGTTNLENCTYSGVLDGNDAGGSGNYGGLVGYVNNNTAAILNITNCLFDGQVINTNPTPGGCTFGGFIGYTNSGIITIKNCLSIGTVESAVWGMYSGAIKQSRSAYINCYYVGELVNGSASTVSIPAIETNSDELASGEICWKLNEETFLDVAWRQTLNENNYPVLDNKAAVVYQTPTGYDCISEDDPDSFSSFISSVIANEEEFLEDLVAYQPLVNEYKETIESWNDIDNYADFIAAYKAAAELKESILKSVASYESYVKACEAAAAELEASSLKGASADLLKVYLQETIEAGDESFPNGSYPYIIETRNLDDEAIAAEITFVNSLLEAAIANDIRPGNEVTRLLVNPTFANDLEGWTTEEDGAAVATGGVAEVMKIARGKGSGRFSISQALAEMPNGIYMMSANGMFRAGSDVYSQYYAGQLFMNGTVNYFMSPGEDAISAEDAEDKVNSDLASDAEYSIDGIDGYVPASFTGCSYAYSSGRYQNFCATEVTDGNLTIGVRSLGTDLSSDDWMPFGGVHIWYLGTAEEASNKLNEVLKGYAARAQVIVDFFVSEDPSDFMQYPNISEDLKDQLSNAIAATKSAATGEEKMALVVTFSNLFNEVHACRKAYIAMFDAANKLFDFLDVLDALGALSEDEYNELDALILEAQNHYSEGDVTTEEALALAERLNIIDDMLPQEDGIYQLSTATQLRLFALTVNNGESDAKAVLKNDIDMEGADDFTPIGNSNSPFSGEFDGQNFKITGFGEFIEEGEDEGFYTLELSGDMQGFFGYVKNATIKNFSIDGAFTYNGGTGYGAIGWAEGSTLINIHSTLNIASVSTSHHIGGICGDMRAGSKAYNCSFSGTITDSHNTHDCIGGIGGYSNENCRYENCANYGTIEYTASNAYAGGICGYVNNDSFVGVFNCLNVGNVRMADSTNPSFGGAFVGRLRSHANSQFVNNYMLQGSAPNTSGENVITANTVSAEQLASGEVCFKLNGDQEEINWFQTLGEDTYPVLDDTHKVVYDAGDGTYVNEKVVVPGSKENPFVVKTSADLANLINLLVSGRMNYVVMEDDVDMAGVTNWTPLFNIPDQSNGYAYIDFDGKNHVIRNLTSKTEGAYDYCGLFGVLCGNVRNLGVENADVTCAGGTGILAGYLGHSTYGRPCYIENVWVTGKLTANGYCGGMFGNIADESYITNCYANVEVTGSGDLTGGIIGRVRNKVVMNNVYAAGTINRGGGIIGGGFQEATPEGSYTNVAVWNNTEQNFGPARDTDALRGILYYDGTNFADMQGQVVAWDPEVWYCDMQPNSYPILKAFAGNKGDLNGDGKVDIADAVTVLNIMAAGEYNAEADVNHDQKVDIADFVTILNIMAAQ